VLNDEAVEFLRGLEGSRGVLGGVDVDAGVAGNSDRRSTEAVREGGEGERIGSLGHSKLTEEKPNETTRFQEG